MPGKLVDTNAVIALFGPDPSLAHQIASDGGARLSVIVLGELYYGARNSQLLAENLDRINQLLLDYEVLDCDAETARHYARIRHALRLKGRPIPENDLWIAATALQYDLTLVTRDAHFAAVDGLRLEHW